ncbi:protein abrupt-like isoform X3 [Eriocheir sinensis]|uniref:protein abrupt-like isoform X3 n=1 Tax=Eriocheir sinensis TaxID=95602 RepID=UPI0021C7C80A|nr:protein abrupt-like isoform X3 [Eriocheir sinensis]
MDEGFIQLKWNTHQLALLNTLSTLRDKQVYTDVTLSCGDQFYPAHRLVLSACSTFFARTLEVANCRSPMLLLHGIEQSTLEQLLMFMYDGQVTISRNDLANLVKAAQWLGVKGLDTTQDKLRTNDSASEHIDSTQVLESWKNYLSSFNNTNLQPESLENGFKLFKNITSILQRDEDSSGQSSKSENQSSEQSNQEANTQDIPDSDRIGSADISAHDNFMNSSFTAQESEDSSSSYSFKGWNNDETLQNCDLKSPNFTTHDEAIETTEGFSNSADESTEVNASKVKRRRRRRGKQHQEIYNFHRLDKKFFGLWFHSTGCSLILLIK